MAVLSLPLTFNNSFWTQDYRRGLETIYGRLEQGAAENDEIVKFIRARATAEKALALALTNPAFTGQPGTGFDVDDGASLLMAFRGLQAESVSQGQVHASVAKELDNLVADPFEEWAFGFKDRVKQSRRTVVDDWLRSYEQAQGEVAKLKHQYIAKVRKADEAEDDAKFAPNQDLDKFTTSPRLQPRDNAPRQPPQRTASVSERIANRLRDIQRRTAAAAASATGSSDIAVTVTGSDPDSKVSPPSESPARTDKGKGKAIDNDDDDDKPLLQSPPPLDAPLPPPKMEIKPPTSPMPPPPPEPILLAGLSLPPAAVSQLLSRASEQLNLRPFRVGILGEYQDCFTGEEFVNWLDENVDGFGGSIDRAEDAAKDLTEREGLLRRVGEFGNLFENSDEAYYQFRPKAFELDKTQTKAQDGGLLTSPTRSTFAPVADNLLKRSGTFVNMVTKAINAQNTNDPPHIRARQEAEAADQAYRTGVRKLDRQRLALEERIEEVLKALQHWESDRLRAVKTVLLQYQGTLANLPKGLESSNERSSTLIASYNPETDLKGLIERYRTGPFRPQAHVYESIAHDESDVVFGIDLRKWTEGGLWATSEEQAKQITVPPFITAFLAGLDASYARLPDDAEKRKAWIYEVPLTSTHHLREALNSVPEGKPISVELFAQYDAPVIASTLKLWLLELDPPLALYEGWDDIRKLYPTVGASAKAQAEDQQPEDQHIQDLSVALQRLPKVHLYVLDALVTHLKNLIDTTKVEEPNEVYITKIALSIGRTILRPKFETDVTMQDRHPTLLFIDLIKNYAAILPPTIARKKRESERKVPVRKRTAPVDMRLSRGKIQIGAEHRDLLAAVEAQRTAAPESAAVAAPQPVQAQAQAAPAPAPAPVAAPVPATPAVPSKDDDLPPRPPVFKEPKSEGEEEEEDDEDEDEEEEDEEDEDEEEEDDEDEEEEKEKAQAKAEGKPKAAPQAEQEEEEDDEEEEEEEDEDDDDEEDDDEEEEEEEEKAPPRPQFKEPPPERVEEIDVPAPPPMPSFAEPPPEPEDAPSANFAASSPVNVTPPTPQHARQTPTDLRRQSLAQATSRTPSPLSPAVGLPSANEDEPVGGRAGGGLVRGPRISRGPRAPGGGSVSSIVNSLNQRSASPPPGSPTFKRFSGNVSPGSRPGSVSGPGTSRRL